MFFRATGPRRGRVLLTVVVVTLLMTFNMAALPASTGDADPCGDGYPEPDLQSTVVHSGDLVLTGTDHLVIENQKYIVEGNVYLSGDAELELRNAELVVDHYPRQEIFASERAVVTAKNSVFSGFLHTHFFDQSSLVADRVFLINLLQVGGQAEATIQNSCIFEDRFGLVQLGEEADVRIVDSVVGALGLEIPVGLPMEIDGLVSGYFESWSARDALAAGLAYNLTLERSTVMENPGYSGGFELGWNVFTSADADLTIRNSVLNKLVVGFDGENVSFSGLQRSEPVSQSIGDVELVDTEIRGQWGIFVSNGDLLVEDSDGVWLWPVGNGDTTIVNTAINEFDPRHYTGTIRLTDSSMTNGFEVFEASVFRMEGTVDMIGTSPLFTSDSFMTREYTLQVVEAATQSPMAGVGLQLTKDGSVEWSDTTATDGTASFEIEFGRSNYEDTWLLEATDQDIQLSRAILITSDTPVQVNLAPDPDGTGWVPIAAVDCGLEAGGSGGPDDPYSSLQDGIDNVGAGGVVDVATGTCEERIDLTDDVTVDGAGAGETVVDGNVFAIDITGARLSNVTVTDDDTAGIHCYDAQLTVTNSVVRDQPHNGIHASACDLTARNNTFVSNGASGINLIDGSQAIVENNVFAFNGDFGLVGEGGAAQFAYNDFWANGAGPYTDDFTPGSGNLYQDPRFISDLDLRYSGDSPCIHAGNPDPAFANPDGTRNTMGAYGGPDGSTADSDADGVLDLSDLCASTVLPDVAPDQKPNRYWVNDLGVFVSDAPNAPSYTMFDAGGCSASQIIDELGLGVGQERFGLSRSALEQWVDLVASMAG